MKQPKIYRQKTAAVIAKTVAKVAACMILAACILFVSLFFYLKRFAVYDENGVHLDFNRQTETAAPEEPAPPVLEPEAQ